MLRVVTAVAILAAVVSISAGGATAPIDFGHPPPADPSTARLAVATGSGDQRLAIWTARNAMRELCLGWRLGPSSARPAAFTCFRRGLEPPLLAVVAGGGRGSQATWGVVAGLASPLVARISAETLFGTRTTSEVALRPAPGFQGWHAFTSGVLEHPWSTIVSGHAADGRVIAAQGGNAIHPPRTGVFVATPPPVNGQAPPATGPAWRALATNLPRSGAVANQAIPLALAHPEVRAILTSNAGWIVGMTGWGDCGGRPLGGLVRFGFAAPASFTATLPAVGKAAGSSAYSTLVRRIQATGWTGMHVWVDTNTKAVVGVSEEARMLPSEDPRRTTTLETVVPAR